MLLEAVHDDVVGSNSVSIMFGLERLDKNDVAVAVAVAVAVLGYHDVLVTTAGADSEAAHVVGVELANGLDLAMCFVGADAGEDNCV